jgi:hypothetical protein
MTPEEKAELRKKRREELGEDAFKTEERRKVGASEFFFYLLRRAARIPLSRAGAPSFSFFLLDAGSF